MTKHRFATAVKLALRTGLFIFSLAVLTACTSPYVIKDVNLSTGSIRQIVVNNLPRGLRRQSENGRTYESNYFNPTNVHEDALNKPERAYASIVVLGTSRPYEIDVRVFREEKNDLNGNYISLGQDQDLAEKIRVSIRKVLADRREDRNVIDEFRAF